MGADPVRHWQASLEGRSPQPTEHAVQLAIQEHLALRWGSDVYCWRNNSGALPDRRGRLVRFGKVGSADILGIWLRGPHAGKLIALEVKRPSTRTRTTPAQRDFLATIATAGGFAGVVTSGADVDALLTRSEAQAA